MFADDNYSEDENKESETVQAPIEDITEDIKDTGNATVEKETEEFYPHIEETAIVGFNVIKDANIEKDKDWLCRITNTAGGDLGDAWEKVGTPKIRGNIISAYNYGAYFGSPLFYKEFGSASSIGDMMFLSVYENVLVIDGEKISQTYSNSVFILMQYYRSTLFRSISLNSFEEGKLIFDIEYTAYNNTDDGYVDSFVMIELDKEAIDGVNIVSVEMNFSYAFFDLKLTKGEGAEKIEKAVFAPTFNYYRLESVVDENANWTDMTEEVQSDHTIEIIELSLKGYGDENAYDVVFEPTGEKRVIQYNSELGICVEGERALVLSDKDREYINDFIKEMFK